MQGLSLEVEGRAQEDGFVLVLVRACAVHVRAHCIYMVAHVRAHVRAFKLRAHALCLGTGLCSFSETVKMCPAVLFTIAVAVVGR